MTIISVKRRDLVENEVCVRGQEDSVLVYVQKPLKLQQLNISSSQRTSSDGLQYATLLRVDWEWLKQEHSKEMNAKMYCKHLLPRHHMLKDLSSLPLAPFYINIPMTITVDNYCAFSCVVSRNLQNNLKPWKDVTRSAIRSCKQTQNWRKRCHGTRLQHALASHTERCTHIYTWS